MLHTIRTCDLHLCKAEDSSVVMLARRPSADVAVECQECAHGAFSASRIQVQSSFPDVVICILSWNYLQVGYYVQC